MYWLDPPVALTFGASYTLIDVSGAPYNVPSDASFCILRFGNATTGSPAHSYCIQMEACCEGETATGPNDGVNTYELHTVLAPVFLYDHGSGDVPTIKIYSEIASTGSGGFQPYIYFEGYLTGAEAVAFTSKQTICTDITIPHATGAWQTTSVASVVPSSAVFAVCEFWAPTPGTATFLIRPTGSGILSGAGCSGSICHDTQVRGFFLAPLNGSRQFDIYTEQGGGSTLLVKCVGYITAGSINATPDVTDVETLSSAAYSTLTASNGGNNGGVIVYFPQHNGNDWRWRIAGSTWNPVGYTGHYTAVNSLVGTDASKQYEIYCTTASAGQMLVYGYIEQAIGIDEESDVADTLVQDLFTLDIDEESAVEDLTRYGEDYEDTLPESAEIADVVTPKKETGRVFTEEVTASDSVTAVRTRPGTGSGSYERYTAYAVGTTGAISYRADYSVYTLVAETEQENFGVCDSTYPFYYELTATVWQTFIGEENPYPDLAPIYVPYTIEATTAYGAVAVEDATRTVYSLYEGEGSYFYGTATAEYDPYTIYTATPGAVAGGATDYEGTASVSYRSYTISISSSNEIFAFGDISYSYRYTAIGYGYTDAILASASSAYPQYSLLANVAHGAFGIALPGPAGTTPVGRIDPEANEYDIYTIVATGRYEFIAAISGSNYTPKYFIDAIGITDVIDVFTGRLVNQYGEAFVDGDGNFIVVKEPVPPSHEVMMSAMNIRNKAVTEYHNFSFNSLTIYGGKIMGANHNGIFIVDSNDDAGDSIDVNVEKLGMDYDTGLRKRATDAYLNLTSDGNYYVGSVADGTQAVFAVTDNDRSLHTRKEDLPKGLIGRHLGWVFRNQDGANFELEEVELVAEVGSRRTKRYYG